MYSDAECRDCDEDVSHFRFPDGQNCSSCGSLLCHECWESHQELVGQGVSCLFNDGDLGFDSDWD